MDHTGAYYHVMAVLLALIHRQRTGEGQGSTSPVPTPR